ncbi:unnamed protein product [Dicrocoelium dendriticum]|nr:unnamed protein product [Dicrocoelium dendriticum]
MSPKMYFRNVQLYFTLFQLNVGLMALSQNSYIREAFYPGGMIIRKCTPVAEIELNFNRTQLENHKLYRHYTTTNAVGDQCYFAEKRKLSIARIVANHPARHIWIILLMQCTKSLT